MRRQQLVLGVGGAIAFLARVLLAPDSALAVATVFNNGAANVVNTSITPNSIEIRDGAGAAPTTVNVQTGALIGTTSGSSISVFDNSILNMSGGDLTDELFLFNNATATISGGHVADDVTTSDNSHVTVNDVNNDDDLEARGNSRMTLNGGGHDEDIEAFDTATVDIFGGMYRTGTDGANIEAAGMSVINIRGGSFGVGKTDNAGAINAIENATINIYGGAIGSQPEGLHAEDNGVINIYGMGSQPASLMAIENGVINILDGPLQNLTALGDGDFTLKGSDGSLNNISAQGTATIRIFGSNFRAFNGTVPLAVGPLAFAAGNLSGTLADGQVISNVPFTRAFLDGASIVLVPEPSTMTLGLALAVLGAMRARRRPL